MKDVMTIQDHLDEYEADPSDYWYEITARDGSTGINLSECIKIKQHPSLTKWVAVYTDEFGDKSSTIIHDEFVMTEYAALDYAVAIVKVHGFLPDNY